LLFYEVSVRSLTYALLTGVCLFSLHGLDNQAWAKKKESSPSKWAGKVEAGYSFDRNAGGAPSSLRGGSKSRGSDEDEEDEDEDEDDDDDVFDDDDITGDDLLDDLDLDEPDLEDELNELEDESDGIIGNEDFDGDGIADGFEDGGDGLETADGAPLDDANGDGIADAPITDAPVVADPVADPAVDPAAAPFRKASAGIGSWHRPRKGKRGDRLTMKAGVTNAYKFNKGLTWKSGANVTAAEQRSRKNDNYLLALTSGPEFTSLKKKLTWGPSLSYARMNKDGKHIFDLYAASFGGKYKITKKLGIKSKYTYSSTNFAIARAESASNQKISVALAMKPFKKTTAELGYAFNTVNTSPNQKEKDVNQITLKFQQDWPYKFFIAGKAGYKWVEFDAAKRRQPLREDRDVTTGISLGREVWKDINMELQYDHRAFDTNIRGKDVSNDRFALVTGWKF
jgi:Surface lipoprotein assembly modifier